MSGCPIGNVITEADIRASFDRSFGTGTGKKVTIECNSDKVRMVSELQINLAGEISPSFAVANLITAGKNGKKDSCPSGEVDRVGFN